MSRNSEIAIATRNLRGLAANIAREATLINGTKSLTLIASLLEDLSWQAAFLRRQCLKEITTVENILAKLAEADNQVKTDIREGV